MIMKLKERKGGIGTFLAAVAMILIVVGIMYTVATPMATATNAAGESANSKINDQFGDGTTDGNLWDAIVGNPSEPPL